MKKFHYIITSLILCFVAQACIENDLSYPDVHVEIEKIDLEGMENYSVDYSTHVISVLLLSLIHI